MKKRVIILFFFIALTMSACGIQAAAQIEKSTEEKSVSGNGNEDSTNAETRKTEKKSSEKENHISKKKSQKEKTEKEKTEKESKIENSNTETEEELKKTENIGEAEQEEAKLPEYTVEAWAESGVMYALNPVNVRCGPATAFDRVGGLNRAQEVTVTGQADTGWYEIMYGEGIAYVSHHYLQNEKPAEEPPAANVQEEASQAAGVPDGQQKETQVQAVTEVKNVAGVIMIGDSRFVQMQESIGENSCTWIAENGKGYLWFNENAVARIDGCVGKGSKVLINLGVNDPGSLNNYITLVNAKAAEWAGKGAKVYYASVNPVWENPYVTEEQVEYFNSQMQNGLSGDVQWIDSHSYLDSIGYKLVDGLHFNAETYQNLYAYFMSCL